MKTKTIILKSRTGSIELSVSRYTHLYRKILEDIPPYLWLLLVKHNALVKYTNNCIFDCINHRLDQEPNMHKDLMTAFMWTSTIEGYDFWKNIYNKRFTK